MKYRWNSLIENVWSYLTFKQQSSRTYRSAGTPVLFPSRPEYSEVALECLQSSKSLCCLNVESDIFFIIRQKTCTFIWNPRVLKKMQYVVMRYEIRNIHILHSKNTRQAEMKHFMLNEFSVHFVAYIYAVGPEVKYLCSSGREWGRAKSHSR